LAAPVYSGDFKLVRHCPLGRMPLLHLLVPKMSYSPCLVAPINVKFGMGTINQHLCTLPVVLL